MARIRTVQQNESLDSVWEELVYTEARLLGDAHTRDLVAAHHALLAALETARTGQRRAWRQEIVAQAQVDAADAALDAATVAFGVTLLAAVKGNRESPRWRRYFPEGPSDIAKLALARQAARVSAWPTSLRSEPEPEVRAYADTFSALLTAAEAALQARVEAAAARADQRAREIAPLIDDLNATRMNTLGALLQRAVAHDKARDWAESFFRRSHRRVGDGGAGGDGGGA